MEIAATKEEAVAFANYESPILLLMDTQLAGPSSGIVAARRIREDQGIGAVLLSGGPTR